MRTEKDFLGEIQIDDDAYYGVQSMRAINNFPITGQMLDPEMVHALATIKCATVMANMETGRMDKKIGDVLIQACKEVMEGELADQFVVDAIQGGAGTSMNMNINEVLSNRALEILGEDKGRYDIVSPNNHANMAQSTNDVIPTSIRLTSINLVDKLIDELEKLQKSFENKAEEFRTVIKMGRTHLQDAVPITLGQEFSVYALIVARAIRRIKYAESNLYTVNMGATAVGTGLNAEPAYIKNFIKSLNELTGREFESSPNLVDGTQSTDEIAELSGALKVSALGFIKIANDLRLMASGPKAGLGEINLPAQQPGSSIMPGKVNPVMAEVVNQTCYQVVGNDLTVSLAVENGQLELNVMEPVMAFRLYDSIKILTNVAKVFRERCVDGITAHEEHLQELVDNSFGICTALLPYIGYEASSEVVDEALKTGKSAKDLILEKKLLSKEEMDIILDPINMTSPGISGKDQIDALRNK